MGDVSNVVFTNGAITRDNGDVYIYFAASNTRMHVAVTTIDKLIDYVFHTPKDPLRSVECVAQRCAQGSLSSLPELCYAYLVYEWWKKKFPQSEIQLMTFLW